MEISDKIKKELDLINDVKDKRQRLTELNKKGYDVIPYLIEILECGDGTPKEKGFKFNKQFGTTGRNISRYPLSDDSKDFFFEEQKDGTYTKWP